LAADALEEGGISREQPLEYEGIRDRYLPEQQFRGRAQHHRSHYALRAVTYRHGSRWTCASPANGSHAHAKQIAIDTLEPDLDLALEL